METEVLIKLKALSPNLRSLLESVEQWDNVVLDPKFDANLYAALTNQCEGDFTSTLALHNTKEPGAEAWRYMMKITEVDENTFRASIETRFNNVRKCTSLSKLIQFLNVIEATERTIVEKGIDPREFDLKLSTAAVSAIPDTIEGGILRNKAILKKLKWRKIRGKAIAMKTVMYPNMTEFEKLIGVRSVAQAEGDPGSTKDNELETEQDGFVCESCNAVVKNKQNQQTTG